MGRRSEKIKSVILCIERNFKNSCVSILTDIAFPAEKLWSESFEDACSKLSSDPLAQNLVINGNDFDDTKFLSMLTELEKKILAISKKKPILQLVYLSESTFKKNREKLQKDYKNIIFRQGQPTKKDFTTAFNPISIRSVVQEKPVSKKKNPQLNSFFEASKHIKNTLSLINEISKEKTRLDALAEVGQRFNGIIGTFSFLGNSAGFKQLKELAIIIDNICRFYEKNRDQSQISEEHYQLLVNAAKYSYQMLKCLREEVPIPDQVVADYEKLLTIFNKHTELSRERFNQDSVDSIIDELSKGVS